MKNKKYTVNERLSLLEKAFTILANEVNSIVTAINMTKEEEK